MKRSSSTEPRRPTGSPQEAPPPQSSPARLGTWASLTGGEETRGPRPASSPHGRGQDGRAAYLSVSSSIGGTWKRAPHGRSLLSSGWSRLGSSGAGPVFVTEPSWDQTEGLRGPHGPWTRASCVPRVGPWGATSEALSSRPRLVSDRKGRCARRVPELPGGPRPRTRWARGQCWLLEHPSGGRALPVSPRRSPQVPSWVCAGKGWWQRLGRVRAPTLTATLVRAARGTGPARCPLTDR